MKELSKNIWGRVALLNQESQQELLSKELPYGKATEIIRIVDPTLYNSSISTNKTHSNIGQKVGGSESSNITKGREKKTKIKNANENQQLTLFDFIN
jgi:hypothetical protein